MTATTITGAPCGHRELTSGCQVCYIATLDRRYAESWFGAGAPAHPSPRGSAGHGGGAARGSGPCRHLGKATGELSLCPSCPGGVKLKTFECARHGTCTPQTKLPGAACCAGCLDYRQALAETVQVCCTSDGIGDALLCMTVCEGIRREYPDKRVLYNLLGGSRRGAPWQVPWIKLFRGYEGVGTGQYPDAQTFFPYESYNRENTERLAKPRWEYYSEVCGVSPKLPEPGPLDTETVQWVKDEAVDVVLAPFGAHSQRVWGAPNWLYLERLLTEGGLSVAVIDGWSQGSDVRCAPFGRALVNESAPHVAALLTMAKCYVGNDSGMSHLAGMLGTPSVVLTAQIRGEKVFGLYPSVRVVNGPLDCGGCHWQRSAGWLPRCDSHCANLQAISPHSVLGAVYGAIGSPSRDWPGPGRSGGAA